MIYEFIIVYGSHPFHWYFTSGIPTLLFTQFPFLIYGAHESKEKNPLYLTIYVVLVYSLLSHKEFRFIYPILPLMILYVGKGIYEFKQKLKNSTFWIVFILLILLPQVFISLYMGMIHQRGPIETMKYLREDNSVESLLFLMPCHHTPGYSYLHKNITFKYLDCSPDSSEDESELFYKNPVTQSQKYLNHDSFSHIIMYDSMYEQVKNITNKKYFIQKKIFHSHLSKRMDSRQSDYIIILKLI